VHCEQRGMSTFPTDLINHTEVQSSVFDRSSSPRRVPLIFFRELPNCHRRKSLSELVELFKLHKLAEMHKCSLLLRRVTKRVTYYRLGDLGPRKDPASFFNLIFSWAAWQSDRKHTQPHDLSSCAKTRRFL
jgi:hypothetical protein